jgi:hypothetical protein
VIGWKTRSQPEKVERGESNEENRTTSSEDEQDHVK